MIRRPRRVIPATLVALVILAACVLVAVSVIQSLAGHAPLISLGALARHVRTLRLDGTIMTSAGAVAAALGLILLGCAVIPGRSGTLALGGPGPVAGVSRAGLRAALTVTAADVDGVTSVRVRVRDRRVTARVRTELTATTELHAAVTAALERRISQAGLARQPQLRASVRFRRRTAA